MCRQDYINHILGQYISFAINLPQKYPKRPFLEKKENIKSNQNVMTDTELEQFAKNFVKK